MSRLYFFIYFFYSIFFDIFFNNIMMYKQLIGIWLLYCVRKLKLRKQPWLWKNGMELIFIRYFKWMWLLWQVHICECCSRLFSQLFKQLNQTKLSKYSSLGCWKTFQTTCVFRFYHVSWTVDLLLLDVTDLETTTTMSNTSNVIAPIIQIVSKATKLHLPLKLPCCSLQAKPKSNRN